MPFFPNYEITPTENFLKMHIIIYYQQHRIILTKGEEYGLKTRIKVYADSYDILGDNCIGIEHGISKTDVLGVMTDFTHKGKQYKTDDIGYRLYVWLWCRPYKLRIFLKKIRMRLQSVLRKKREK